MTEIVCKYIEVCVYIRSGNGIKYLVLKRNANVILPGIWQFVTGNINEGEKAYEAALREFKEETGLKAEKFLIGPDVTAFYRHDNDSMNIIPVFIAEVRSEGITLCEEHCEHRWLGYDEAQNLLHWYDQKENIRKINDCLNNPGIYKTLVEIKNIK